MKGLSKILSNPAVSQFLLGMGQGINQTNRPGVSSLASLSAGFNAGGQQVANWQREQEAKKDREMMRQLRDQQLKAAINEQERIRKAEERRTSFLEGVTNLDMDDPQKMRAMLFRHIDVPEARALWGLGLEEQKATLSALKHKADVRRNELLNSKTQMEVLKLADEFRDDAESDTVVAKATEILKGDAPIAEKLSELEPLLGDKEVRDIYKRLADVESGGTVRQVTVQDGNISITEGPPGAIDKVSARKSRERFADLAQVRMQTQSTLNEARQRLQDATITGTPGAMQSAAVSIGSAAGRMMEAVGFDNIPIAGNLAGTIRKIETAGWGEAAKERALLNDSLTLLAQQITDQLPERGRRLKSEVEEIREMVGRGTGNPEVLLTKLSSLVERFADIQTQQYIAETYGSMGAAIAKAPENELLAFPPNIMSNGQLVSWVNRISDVLDMPLGSMTQQQAKYLQDNLHLVADPSKRAEVAIILDEKLKGAY